MYFPRSFITNDPAITLYVQERGDRLQFTATNAVTGSQHKELILPHQIQQVLDYFGCTRTE